MKKLITILLFAGLAAGVWAQESTEKKFTFDGGAGLSFGLFDSLNNTAFGDLSGLATLASLRGGIDGSALYRINDWASAGGQLGLYVLQFSSGGSTYTFFDIPVRAVAKFGSKGLAIQPYLGYYVTPIGFPFPGLEAGARAILGSFFLEGSMVLGQPQWKHVAFGVELEDFFSL